jgi:hypothetical protein
VTAWNLVDKYQRFEGTCCFLLQKNVLVHLGQYYILKKEISAPDEENRATL